LQKKISLSINTSSFISYFIKTNKPCFIYLKILPTARVYSSTLIWIGPVGLTNLLISKWIIIYILFYLENTSFGSFVSEWYMLRSCKAFYLSEIWPRKTLIYCKLFFEINFPLLPLVSYNEICFLSVPLHLLLIWSQYIILQLSHP
jgi:hypothetical protein